MACSLEERLRELREVFISPLPGKVCSFSRSFSQLLLLRNYETMKLRGSETSSSTLTLRAFLKVGEGAFNSSLLASAGAPINNVSLCSNRWTIFYLTRAMTTLFPLKSLFARILARFYAKMRAGNIKNLLHCLLGWRTCFIQLRQSAPHTTV